MGKGKKNPNVNSVEHNTSARFIDSPDSDSDLNDGWVIVKKQRVVILVPLLPVSDISPIKLKEEPRQSEISSVKGLDDAPAFARTRTIVRPAVSVDQRLRALNLERKLRRAGGLSEWLVSLGLGQFARLFKRKGVGKFHLVNMTMKKLKDMGATDAVGPRRKLIHAIDCVCEPCCFQVLR